MKSFLKGAGIALIMMIWIGLLVGGLLLLDLNQVGPALVCFVVFVAGLGGLIGLDAGL